MDVKQLHHITVASPCTASWDEMVGDDHVRHCKLCDKEVYNLSSMRIEDVAALVERKQGTLCARFYRRADGTLLTEDCPQGLAAARRRMAAIAGVVAAAGAFLIAHVSAAVGVKPRGSQSTRFDTPPAHQRLASPPPPVTPSRAPLTPEEEVQRLVASAGPPPIPDPKVVASVKAEEAKQPSCTMGAIAFAPPPPPIPPVQFKINGIAGSAGRFLATIEFEGKAYAVEKGTKVPDDANPAFDVKEIASDRVVVFDRKSNRLYTRAFILSR